MKHFIIIAALLTATIAHAQKSDRVNADICKEWGDFAAEVMTLRQQEKPLNEVMALTHVGIAPGATKAITLDAYERRSAKTAAEQERAVSEFRNQVELACYKRPQ